jgi:6-phosphogluconolactonase (cycloisomerase 2 family)
MTFATMSRRFLYTFGCATLPVIVSLLLTASPLRAQQNLVYINGDITTAGQNAVIALVNDGAGNLTPVPGSPFLTGGTGVGGTFTSMMDAQWDSDQEVVINQAGTLLFAVNGHSNDISSFTVNSDGSLTRVTGSPFASGGPQPASLGYRDNAFGNGVSLMVVANKDSDPLQTQTAPNYTTFKVNSAGVLKMNPGSTLTLPAGSSPSQAMIRNRGPIFLFGIQFAAKNLSSYKLNRAGIMSLISSQTLTNDAVGAVFHPVLNGIYVTLPPASRVDVFSYNTAGVLAKTGSASNQGTDVCWDTMNAAGTRLYTAETFSSSVTVYDTTNPKAPVQLQHVTAMGTGALTSHMHLDPTEKFLYVLDRTAILHVFDVAADGTITENHAPYNLGLPFGTVPLGVAVLLK